MSTSRVANVISARTYPIDSASSQWKITHNLGYNPSVQTTVKDPESGLMQVWLAKDVTYPDLNTVIIYWSEPRSGEVRLS